LAHQGRFGQVAGVHAVADLEPRSDHLVEQRRERLYERLGRGRGHHRRWGGGAGCPALRPPAPAETFWSMNSDTISSTSRSMPSTVAPSYRRKNVRRNSPRSRRSAMRYEGIREKPPASSSGPWSHGRSAIRDQT